ncbi:unnamed protein product [Rotaria sp. Silwood1]|nr:unnamed protein product [Rotaria sp. Silwood1]CAF4994276.1 unnamed protein product [Rotaria sp. Silwood1]CAF5009142.1 unnamed protein product [Rotaria sp. Silwood1]
MIHVKGYQEKTEAITSLVRFEIKGNYNPPIEQNQSIIIDDADYIVPSQVNDAFFLMTSYVQIDQEYKRCSEASNVREAICTDDKQCQLNRDLSKGNDRWTGRCLKKNSSSISYSRSKRGLCELQGWCPVLNDSIMPTLSEETLNFSLSIRNFIEFKRFKLRRTNINTNISYLRMCNYDPIKHKTCPIFRIGTILDIVEPDPYEQIKMLKFGGIILINIDWMCNVDRSLDRCIPDYSFGRLDGRFREESFSSGYNFRFASHWKHENRSFRTLTKAFGLRFIVSVSGCAVRFNLIILILNIGLLIGAICLITYIFDNMGLYIYCHSAVDRSQKSKDVPDKSKSRNEQTRLTE